MKLRLLAVSLILFVAAWLPITAQQSSTSQPAAKPDQPATTCCRKDAGAQSMPCCEGKDSKDMPCCHKGAKSALDKQAPTVCCDGQDGKTCGTKDTPSKPFAPHCCKGQGAKLCAKNGQECGAVSECKSCCDKNTTAANGTNLKTCCAAKDHSCCHSKSNG